MSSHYEYDPEVDTEALQADNEALRRRVAELEGAEKVRRVDAEERMVEELADATSFEAAKEILRREGRLAE